jgi:ribosomal protein L35AE/L33A
MVSKQDVKKLVGQQIYAVKKDGSVFEGKLLQTRGNKLILAWI